MDLATAKDELSTLIEPMIPTPQDVNPDKTRLAQLDDDEKEELRFQRLSYKRKVATFDLQKATVATLRSFIQETITPTYLTYTFDCETPYDMLVALKQRVAPTDPARKVELINQYQKLKKLHATRTWTPGSSSGRRRTRNANSSNSLTSRTTAHCTTSSMSSQA